MSMNCRQDIPDVTVIGKSSSQICNVDYAESKEGLSVTVTAVSESLKESVSYKILFLQGDKDVADLKNIRVIGHELDFKPDGTYYYVKRKAGEYKIPVIEAVKFAEDQTVTTEIKGESSVYNITVKSADGSNDKKYTVEISPVPSEVGTLDMIYYNGVKIEGFDPNVNEYSLGTPTSDTTSSTTLMCDSSSTVIFGLTLWVPGGVRS